MSWQNISKDSTQARYIDRDLKIARNESQF